MKIHIYIIILLLALGYSSNCNAGLPKYAGTKSKSLLNTGQWFKIKIERTGIHKISYEELISIGLNSPDKVRIFGYGGGQLPYPNNQENFDDLIELPIDIVSPTGVLTPDSYLLFYSKGPVTWNYSSAIDMFTHHKHQYSKYIYLFLTDSFGPGKRIENYPVPTETPNLFIDNTDSYDFVDNDHINLIKSGSIWYDNKISSSGSKNYNFEFYDLIKTLPIKLYTRVAGKNANNAPAASINIKQNNSPLSNIAVTPYLSTYTKAVASTLQTSFLSSENGIEFAFELVGGDLNTEGYIDYLCLNATEKLSLSNKNHLLFRNKESIGPSNVCAFSIDAYNSTYHIWEVTNAVEPKRMEVSAGGDFVAKTDSLLEFAAANSNGFYSPIFQDEDLGKVENQNLHEVDIPELLVITHPLFLSQAEELAELHRNHDDMKVYVTTPEKIYNEFSSGTPDASAIRNFIRYLHNQTNGSELKYLLLFGDGSYDNLSTSNENSNLIPTYQSYNGESETSSFVTDDFYGLLGNDEGGSVGRVDIGIGRFPVQTTSEADLMVEKVKNYISDASNGAWKSTICFIGDDEDGQLHMQQADEVAAAIDTNHPAYTVNKIYLDAYTQESTPSGQRYPDVTQAINEQVAQGALIIDYVGHGNTRLIAKEEILKTSDVRAWKNKNKLSVFVTASCEVGRFDDYESTSLGEWILLNPDGGGIATITTTRVVYSGGNHALNTNLFANVFNPSLRLGDLIRLAKNNTGTPTSINRRNFTLLGDPALRLPIPEHTVVPTSLNGNTISAELSSSTQPARIKITSNVVDTLKALSLATVSGYVEDQNGQAIITSGTLYISVYDKANQLETYGNDNTTPLAYQVQNSLLFKGKAGISSGYFSFSFRVPKDISYTYGRGKMSLLANLEPEEAIGYLNNFIIGGNASDYPDDFIGPDMELYMNDTTFISGGITDENPVLLIHLEDESGINTTGIGIGHNLTAVIDNNYDNVIVLNPFYEGKIDTYKAGTISYPLNNLPSGFHTIKVTAWDNQNNVSEKEINFQVNNSSNPVIEELINIPNPIAGHTEFSFLHNQANTSFDVELSIFNLMGQKVQELIQVNSSTGFASDPISWDGTGFGGQVLDNGLYPYKVCISTIDGQKTCKSSKLIIIK